MTIKHSYRFFPWPEDTCPAELFPGDDFAPDEARTTLPVDDFRDDDSELL